jgi:hypothetical protein
VIRRCVETDGATWISYLDKARDALPAATRGEPRPPHLAPADAMVLRKAWEMGVAIVACQTVVHLDGDVVTRLNRDFEMNGATAETALSLHRQSVEVSMGQWRALFRIVADIAGTAVSALLPGGKVPR